jgi:hypothetical protein
MELVYAFINMMNIDMMNIDMNNGWIPAEE